MKKYEKPLYSLIPLDTFKAVLGLDDREDKLATFCLVSSTFSIEQYCKRRLLRKRHFEKIEFIGDLFLPFLEYPVNKVLAVYSLPCMGRGESQIVEPELYSVIPEEGTLDDVPFSLSFSRALLRYKGIAAIKAVYLAGYNASNVPPDLSMACLELSAWNLNRYKGRRIGMTGNVRGKGKDGENFEMSMPENVRALLEPYRRKLI